MKNMLYYYFIFCFCKKLLYLYLYIQVDSKIFKETCYGQCCNHAQAGSIG
jgi:hypothetical protein